MQPKALIDVPDLKRQAAWHDRALFEQHRRDHSPATRAALVERFLPLARHLAVRYRGRADLDDLHQVASIGLLKAIDRFDPGRGLAFSTFAVPTILGELRRYFRDYGWSVRVPRDLQELSLRIDRVTEELTAQLGRPPTATELAEKTGAALEQVVDALATRTAHHPDSLDRPFLDGDGETIDHLGGVDDPGFAQVENAVVVDALLEGLTEREQMILRLRFERELTQSEIGQKVGLSQMQVSRLIRSSIATLQASAATP